MLHIFRRIRKGITDSGQVKKSSSSMVERYSLYAIGEITLVVIGILLAIQIDNWNNQRIESNIEREILRELRISVNEDLNRCKNSFGHIKRIETKIHQLQLLLNKGDTAENMDSLFGAVYGILRFEINTASYEELKSHGINLITDDDIRRLTVRTYDTHLKAIQHMNKIEDNVVLEALRPYYLSNFTKIRFSETATPKSIDAILRDDYFLNLVDYRLTVLRTLHFRTYPDIIKDMSELLQRIDSFIGD